MCECPEFADLKRSEYHMARLLAPPALDAFREYAAQVQGEHVSTCRRCKDAGTQ